MVKHLAAAMLLALASSGVAGAGIVAMSGDVAIPIPAPTSVVPPDHAEDGVIHVFDEQTNVAVPVGGLQADMTVHYTTYDPPLGRTLATIPAGTIVNSYYIHFDPLTTGGTSGSVTFAEPIIAVIAEGDFAAYTAVSNPPGNTLEPSNVLGNLTTTYPGAPLEQLGLENTPDRLTLFENTLAMSFGAGSPGDRVRVLTDPNAAPLCGNATLDAGETCDDVNFFAGDGCFGCQAEYCYACTGPATCNPIATCTNGDGCCAPGCTPATDDDCSSKCTQGKLKCVSIKKSCRIKCYEKAALQGAPVDVDCLNKCSAKFDYCFFKIELKGGCATVGDAAAIEAKVDAFVLDVATELDAAPVDDLSKCRYRKLRCVSNYDKCVLGLIGRAARKQVPVDPAKRAKCETKYATCWASAEGGSCETVGDVSPIRNKDDAFLDDVSCELGVCP